MKHAYLILAHNEPELLQLLVSRLDDERNDIYIHFDRKMTEVPDLQVSQAGLFVLPERADVRWADVSMLEAEYLLFHAARESGREYSYYHLLSGVDLPLKTQDYIHRFFQENAGKEFVGLHQSPLNYHFDQALHYLHPFSDSFRGSGLGFWAKRLIRFSLIRAQQLLGLRRNKGVPFHKGGQWVSITTDLVDYLLQHEEETLAIYRGTFGSDEFFVPTLIWGTPFMERLYDATDESRGAMRAIGWRADGMLHDYTMADLPALQQTDLLFGRKFNMKDRAFIAEVLKLSAPTR